MELPYIYSLEDGDCAYVEQSSDCDFVKEEIYFEKDKDKKRKDNQ